MPGQPKANVVVKHVSFDGNNGYQHSQGKEEKAQEASLVQVAVARLQNDAEITAVPVKPNDYQTFR